MTMNATNDKELTKEQLYKIHLDGLKDRIKTLEDELTSLRASRDDEQQRKDEFGKRIIELAVARDSSLAEIKRLEGELASRPALVKAAEMARDWCNHKRIIAVIREKYNIPDTQNCEKFIYDKLDSALAQVSAPAPAKDGVVLFTNPDSTFLTGKHLSRCMRCHKGVWQETPTRKEPTDPDEYAKQFPHERRLSDSEAAAFLKEHPLPKDAFSPAPSREKAPSDANKSERDGLRLLGREYASLCDHIDSLEQRIESTVGRIRKRVNICPQRDCPTCRMMTDWADALDASKGKVKP